MAHSAAGLSDLPSMQHSQKHPANQRCISRHEGAGLWTRYPPSEQSRSWRRYVAQAINSSCVVIGRSEPFIRSQELQIEGWLESIISPTSLPTSFRHRSNTHVCSTRPEHWRRTQNARDRAAFCSPEVLMARSREELGYPMNNCSNEES
jgi:hypothetical protein